MVEPKAGIKSAPVSYEAAGCVAYIPDRNAITSRPVAGYRRSGRLHFLLGTLDPLLPFQASSSMAIPLPLPPHKSPRIHTNKKSRL